MKLYLSVRPNQIISLELRWPERLAESVQLVEPGQQVGSGQLAELERLAKRPEPRQLAGSGRLAGFEQLAEPGQPELAVGWQLAYYLSVVSQPVTFALRSCCCLSC